ncbi:MAG: hypothetical protein WBW61_10795 [Rhodanobacteraceae bacterium]
MLAIAFFFETLRGATRLRLAVFDCVAVDFASERFAERAVGFAGAVRADLRADRFAAISLVLRVDGRAAPTPDLRVFPAAVFFRAAPGVATPEDPLRWVMVSAPLPFRGGFRALGAALLADALERAGVLPVEVAPPRPADFTAAVFFFRGLPALLRLRLGALPVVADGDLRVLVLVTGMLSLPSGKSADRFAIINSTRNVYRSQPDATSAVFLEAQDGARASPR